MQPFEFTFTFQRDAQDQNFEAFYILEAHRCTVVTLGLFHSPTSLPFISPHFYTQLCGLCPIKSCREPLCITCTTTAFTIDPQAWHQALASAPLKPILVVRHLETKRTPKTAVIELYHFAIWTPYFRGSAHLATFYLMGQIASSRAAPLFGPTLGCASSRADPLPPRDHLAITASSPRCLPRTHWLKSARSRGKQAPTCSYLLETLNSMLKHAVG